MVSFPSSLSLLLVSAFPRDDMIDQNAVGPGVKWALISDLKSPIDVCSVSLSHFLSHKNGGESVSKAVFENLIE